MNTFPHTVFKEWLKRSSYYFVLEMDWPDATDISERILNWFVPRINDNELQSALFQCFSSASDAYEASIFETDRSRFRVFFITLLKEIDAIEGKLLTQPEIDSVVNGQLRCWLMSEFFNKVQTKIINEGERDGW